MSLKSFHLFFIVVSILLCVFVSIWGFDKNNAIAYPSVAGAIGLVFYLFWFIKKGKVKDVSTLIAALVLSPFASSPAKACAVCFGLTDLDTTKALNNSVIFMIGITAVVLTGLTILMLKIISLAKSTPKI